MPLPERLAQQIERAAGRPLSEMDTQRVIIEPLLTWLGFDIYDLDQVAEQVPVVGAGRAQGDGAIDYLLSLDGRPHVVIEAKGLRGDRRAILEDRAAIQQVNTYCHSHAAQPRWGVLTNGLVWAIYDARARCDVFSRRILTLDILTEPDLLRALSAGWRNHLERFADELNDARAVPNEGIRNRAIRDIERDYKERFSSVAPTPGPPPNLTLAASTPAPTAPPSRAPRRPPASAPVESPRVQAPTPPSPAASTPSPAATPTPAQRPTPAPSGAGGAVATYRQLPEKRGKPTRLLLPDGSHEITSWTRVVVLTAEYLVRRGTLRPTAQVAWTTRPLISADGSAEMFKPKVLSNGWTIETNWSAEHSVRLAGDLLSACGESADGFSVSYELGAGAAAPLERRRRAPEAGGTR